MLSLLSRGNAETLRDCHDDDNPIKKHEIICSFVMLGEFEFYPTPPPKVKPQASFDGYIQKKAHCIDSSESFESCKKIFCQEYPESCVGRIFPPYEAFAAEEF